MVNVGGTECMCGGTHVKNTADIGSFTATKIKKVIKWSTVTCRTNFMLSSSYSTILTEQEEHSCILHPK